MKILSFDIGIKNLSYCLLDDSKQILDWGIINISCDDVCQHINSKNIECCNSATCITEDNILLCSSHANN